MIDKRELKRLNLKIGRYLDPLALFLLFAVFILPALAVLNLSPRSKSINNVLGTVSKQEISLVLVGGTHAYIDDERISFPNESMTRYEAKLIKHEAGQYSKPVLQIKNSYFQDARIEVTGGTTNPTGSPISIIYDNKEYILQDESGSPQVVSIRIKDQSKGIMYLKFDSNIPLRFNENVEINIVQK